MRIYSMTATFGKLEHASLTLKPGLNIIEAPNEWGKSTWCAFLAAMLYGIDSRAHSTTKQGLADKARYEPWSGQPMSGRIELNWNNRDITIERTSTKRAAFRQFRAYDTHSGQDIPELTGDNCGQMLLGVEKEVFLRAGFIRLTDMPVTPSEALRRRLNALVTTGDESGAADKLAQQLRDLKNECRANRTHGLLPQAETQRDGLMQTLSRLTALKAEASSLDNLLLQQERAHQTLLARQTLRNDEEAQRRQETLSRLQQLRLRRGETTAQREALPPAPEPVTLDPVADLETYRRTRKKMSSLFFLLPALLAFACLLIPGILGLLLWLLGEVLDLVIFILDYISFKKSMVKLRELEAKYGGLPPEQWEAYVASVHLARQTHAQTVARLETEKAELDDRIQRLEQRLIQAAPPQEDGLPALLAQLHQTQLQRGRCQGQIEALGDEAALRSQLGAVEERIRQLHHTYVALELAQQTLAKATAQLQSRFAPRITHRAAELFGQLTGGRYSRLTLTDSLELHTCAESEETLRSILWRSDGTADQLYLALRLAVAGELTPDAPLVLDDALVRFDDTRLRSAMAVLQDEAKQKQVILFTCQSREANL